MHSREPRTKPTAPPRVTSMSELVEIIADRESKGERLQEIRVEVHPDSYHRLLIDCMRSGDVKSGVGSKFSLRYRDVWVKVGTRDVD